MPNLACQFPGFSHKTQAAIRANVTCRVGELKCVEQGRHAMEAISTHGRANTPYDVVIIGAGPAGIAATLAAKQLGLRYVIIEQEDTFGGTTLITPGARLS